MFNPATINEIYVLCEHCGREYQFGDLNNKERAEMNAGRACPSDDCSYRDEVESGQLRANDMPKAELHNHYIDKPKGN